MKNCFWIIELIEPNKFDFTQSNIVSIYAKNWSMKTSFAKVFKKIQDWKEKDIKDEIFWEKTECEIKVDDENIKSDDIYVIGSSDLDYNSNEISSLLLNNELKEKFDKLLNLKFNLFGVLKWNVWLAIPKSEKDLNISTMEEKIALDFWHKGIGLFELFESITLWTENTTEIKYKEIFDGSTLEKTVILPDFQNNLRKFKEKWEKIYENSPFLSPWKFSFSNFIDVCNSIKKNNLFEVEKNWLCLAWEIKDEKLTRVELDKIIKELKDTDEFMKISEKLNSTVKWKNLLHHLENNLNLISDLADIKNFRRRLWYQYLKDARNEISWKLYFDEIKEKYKELKKNITAEKLENSKWESAVNTFNSRFSMPFQMDIENLEEAVFWEIPKVIFNFCKKRETHSCLKNDCKAKWNIVSKNKNNFIDCLSQWEKRSLYLLNIIFDIEKIKKDIEVDRSIEKLIIIDDIADSFDYKNKYAIIEYLKDISEIQSNIWTEAVPKMIHNFKMIILTHNFDFFRTVNDRLIVHREKKLHVNCCINSIDLFQEDYQSNPFDTWKDVLKSKERYGIVYNVINAKKHILSLIPFIRNLIDYWEDKKVINFNWITKDKFLLTSLLHIKSETNNITINELKIVFKQYIWKDNFDWSILNTEKIVDIYNDIIDNHLSSKLEDKIIIAIGIRLEAEKFMIREINDSTFCDSISKNQTKELYNRYKNDFWKHFVLETVNLMTPENIHLNSFMYEPILDMDIIELKKLYEDVKKLSREE